ncbi:retrotransposon gag domain, retroviral aspartyl protease, partial [Tanacetum coccineum]
MVIDKSWTSLGKHEKAFYTGLKKFVDDCKPLVDSAGNIRCPCKSCRLVLWVSIKHLSDHISKYGFDPSYKTWIHHGEPDLPPPPPVMDNTRQPQMSDMTACLMNKMSQLKEILVKGKLTDSIFNAMLEFFRSVFPTAKGYKLPPSYYAIKKTFKTIGLGLQRLYKSSHTAKEMTWHTTGKCTEPGKMQHTVDGRAWKEFDTKYLNFAAEPRNVRLGLAADGFNPFGNLIQSYSMWPAKPGVETIDVATGLKFTMRAMVPWTINDFPALSSLSRWSGQGYRACPTCNKDTPSVRVLGKTAYVGHRRFLKKPHKWRRSLEFNGETENGDPPREFSQDAIMTQLARLPTRVKAQSKVINILCNIELIYPLAFFDIMIQLVIHLPLEAIFGGPIRP